MAVPPAPDDAVGATGTTEDEQPADRGPSTAPGRRPRGATALFAAFLAVIVASAAVLVALLVTDGDDDAAGSGASGGSGGSGGGVGSEADQVQRDAVMSATQQFVVTVNTYGPDLLTDDGTMPEYVESVSTLMTEEFAAGFRESVVLPEQQVSQSGYGRTGQVYGLGVSTMDADSATVLVGFVRTDSYPREGGGTGRVELAGDPERWQVELVRDGDRWLVDDYVKIPEVLAEQGEGATPAPTEPPTEPPTSPSSSEGGAG